MTVEQIMQRANTVKDVMDIFISGDKAIARRRKQISVRYEVGEGLEVLGPSFLEPNHLKWRPF